LSSKSASLAILGAWCCPGKVTRKEPVWIEDPDVPAIHDRLMADYGSGRDCATKRLRSPLSPDRGGTLLMLTLHR